MHRTESAKVRWEETRFYKRPKPWLVGFGEWGDYLSATLSMLGCTAQRTVEEKNSFFAIIFICAKRLRRRSSVLNTEDFHNLNKQKIGRE
jgi:hypothetical protein